jgi:signal transduction histidine kinase
LVALVSNAIKFTPTHGHVSLRVRRDEGWLRFDVTDGGVGIPETQFTQIFEPFTQLNLSDAERKGGLGLGLAIAKRLVELHGGHLSVVSQLGVGSKFSVSLPAERAAAGLG